MLLGVGPAAELVFYYNPVSTLAESVIDDAFIFKFDANLFYELIALNSDESPPYPRLLLEPNYLPNPSFPRGLDCILIIIVLLPLLSPKD